MPHGKYWHSHISQLKIPDNKFYQLFIVCGLGPKLIPHLAIHVRAVNVVQLALHELHNLQGFSHFTSTDLFIINPWRACAARVTVLGLCVCACVCVCYSTSQVFIRATNDITLLGGGWRSKILNDFLWKCFVAKLERFLLVRLHDKSAIFTLRKTRMRMNLDRVASGRFVLGETFIANLIIGH